jgi:hypothetical protein
LPLAEEPEASRLLPVRLPLFLGNNLSIGGAIELVVIAGTINHYILPALVSLATLVVTLLIPFFVTFVAFLLTIIVPFLLLLSALLMTWSR